MAWNVVPIFVLGFVAGKDGTVFTMTIILLQVIGLIPSPLGEVPSVAVGPLPLTLFFLVCCSDPNKFRILVLQHGLCKTDQLFILTFRCR